MKQFMPVTIAGKIWVLFLFGYAITTQYRASQIYGDPFLTFLIDGSITFLIYIFFFYALPLTIFNRIKNKKNTG